MKAGWKSLRAAVDACALVRRVLAFAVVAVSLRLDGGPPTDPDRYRRKLELLVLVQS